MVAALVAVGTAAAVTCRATVAPHNNSLPAISGSATAGSTLTANPGTWSGSTPITFQYQWRICDGNGAACHESPARRGRPTSSRATTPATRAPAGDRQQLRRSANATSVPSEVASAGTGPTNTVAPTITGSTNTRWHAHGQPGTWTGPAPITFTYQWTICDDKGAACHDISGATSNTYVVKSGDAGNTIRVR